MGLEVLDSRLCQLLLIKLFLQDIFLAILNQTHLQQLFIFTDPSRLPQSHNFGTLIQR